MADMKQVLSRLAERTAQNRVPWRKGDLTDTYEASLGSLSFTIMGPRRGSEGPIYLSITDDRGETIGDAIYVPKEPEVNHDLVSILDEARKVSSDDSRLDAVLDALDAAPSVPS